MAKSYRCFLCPGQPTFTVPAGTDPQAAWMKHYMAQHYEGE